MRRPFSFITIPTLLGVIFYYYFSINVRTLYLIFIVTLIIYVLAIALDLNRNIYTMVLFFVLGILISHLKINNNILTDFTDKRVKLTGTIKEVKLANEDNKRYIVDVKKIFYDGEVYSINEKMILKIIGQKELEVGDKVVFDAILNEPKENTNPKMFNYKLYLLSNNIYTTANIKDFSIKKIEKQTLPWYEKSKIIFKDKIENTLDMHLSKENSSLMKSIILGDYVYLDEYTALKYRELGLSHIMAVSGLHIGIISVFFITTMAYLGIDRRINYILTIILIWSYAYIVGFPPSVIRSNTMFTIFFFSQLLAERYDHINTLLFAMFIILVQNPFNLFSLGFQLSILATLFIILLTPILKNKFYPYRNSAINSLCGIIAAQIGVAPIIAYYFNNLSLVSIFANLIVVPILSICLILSFVLVLMSLFSIYISHSVGVVLNFLLNIQNMITKFIYSIPITTIKLSSPDIVNILLYYFLILCIFKIIGVDKFPVYINKVIVFYLIILITWTSCFYILDDSLTINFVDVGQGDCMLVERNREKYLIDTGGSIFESFDVGEKIVLPYLTKKGIFNINGVFISHFDLDHCKSLPYLMDNINIKRIFIGYKNEENELYNNIIEKAKEKNIPITLLNVEDKLHIDKNTYFEVISPDKIIISQEKQSENNRSLVLILNYYDKNIMFTGDVEEEAEKHIIGNMDCNVNFLKVPHHGSITSSTSEFLDTLEPKYAFIQVGKNNFGHPRKEVLERYHDRNISVYRNDLDGHISLYIDSKNIEIHTCNKEKFSIIESIIKYNGIVSFFIIYSIVSFIFIKILSFYIEELNKIELQRT